VRSRRRGDGLDIQRGDKVRLKKVPASSDRAQVVSFDGRIVVVALPSGEIVSVGAEEITNFSSAARRAWRSRPERHVGRPRGIVKDRISVTVRIDRKLWQRVRALETAGILTERTEWLNATLRQAVAPLEQSGSESGEFNESRSVNI
jgi:hypothetical protein